jgi:hypothetical protein
VSDKRPEREVSLSKELAETKRENHKLRRQLAKAEKRLVKALQAGAPVSDDESSPVPVDTPADGCPECAEPIRVVSIGGKVLKACPKCKWRKVD